MTSNVVVQASNLTKVYGKFVALDSLSLTLERGRVLGFVGPNGAGKTTTIKILVGLAKATSGQATICGAICGTDTARIKTLVGYMPDVFGSYDNMRVMEYLDFFGAAFRIPRRDRRRRIDLCLEMTGAARMKDLFVDALSHGMKQRVALTRTLLHDPQVLILDEPANGLDPQARVEMRQVILELARQGKSIIVTSHILPELARICDTIAMITSGKLRAFGTLDDIMKIVCQRRVITIGLADPADASKAESLVRLELGNDRSVVDSGVPGELRFDTDRDDAGLASLLKHLVIGGVSVAQFRDMPMDLEDAFLTVTGQAGATRADAPTRPHSPVNAARSAL